MVNLWQRFKDLNPPVRWLIYVVLTIFGLSMLFAPRPRPVDWNEISFQTESSSEIYFHNMRSYYYNINERDKAPFIIYRLKRGGSGWLSFMIVENRSADEAYVFSEWGELFEGLEEPKVYFGKDSIPEQGFEGFNNEDHYRFAARCYRSLLLHEQIEVRDRYNIVYQLFTKPVQRKNALILLEDYFKLVKKNHNV